MIDKIGYVLKNHAPAVNFFLILRSVLHFWDDLIDKDRPITDQDINGVMWNALVELPRNPFYRQHFDTLNPMLVNAIANWQAATEFERTGGAKRLQIAFIARSDYLNLLLHSAYLVGGRDWMMQVTPLVLEDKQPMTRLIFNDKERIGAWVAREVEHTASFGDYYAMGIEQAGEIVAGIVFHQFNGANAVAHIAVKKTTKTLITLLEHAANYAFNQCQLKRLTGMVTDSNQKALKLDLHLGWEEEFVMKCAGKDGEDMHVLVLWPERCRWLKKRGTL